MKYNYKKRWLVEKKLKGLQENLKRILIDNSSLTSRVAEKKNPIKLISSRTYLTKQKDKSSKKYSLVREVKIQGYLDNDVIAKSTIPVQQITGQLTYIKFLGNKSLATVLFKKPIFFKESIEYIVTKKHVVRITFFKRKKHTIKVEERFPIQNNYEYMNLIKCRQNIIY